MMKVQRASCDCSLKLWRARRSEREADEQGSCEGGSKSAGAKRGRVGSGRVTGVGGARAGSQCKQASQLAWQRRAALLPDVLTERTDKKSSELTLPKAKGCCSQVSHGKGGPSAVRWFGCEIRHYAAVLLLCRQTGADESEIPLSRLELGGTQAGLRRNPLPPNIAPCRQVMQVIQAPYVRLLLHSSIRLHGVNLAHNNARQQKCPRDVGGCLRPLSLCSTVCRPTTAVRRIQKRGGPVWTTSRGACKMGPSYGKIGIVRPVPIQIGDA